MEAKVLTKRYVNIKNYYYTFSAEHVLILHIILQPLMLLTVNRVSMTKHIAMWSCPRSCSTLITRSFEQLEKCIIFDEPFYASYLLKHAFDHPEREAVIAHRETDYQKVIQLITSELSDGELFSFQKHMAKHILPDYERDWIKSLNNFFLVRNPQEIILSYEKECQVVTKDEIGMEALYNLFLEIKSLTNETPLVVDASDLLKNPQGFLSVICSKLGLKFSEKMLSWEPGLQGKIEKLNSPFPWLWTGELPDTGWYSNIKKSTGFIPYEEKEISLPDKLMAIFEDCLPFYEKLSQFCLRID
jgi:hypothetical protein